MKYLPLLWANLKRRWVRTMFTVAAICVAFILLAILGALNAAFTAGVELSGNDRLMMMHKVSMIQLLPQTYGPRIAQVPGVRTVAHSTWFGGVYQDPKNFFPKLAINPEYLELYPEVLIPPDQLETFLSTRTGAIAGRSLIDKYGWKIGDKIPIQGDIWRKKDGSSTWEFDLVGVYDAEEKAVDKTGFYFRYDYLEEAANTGGRVGWYIIGVEEPEQAPQIAETLDDTFANSPAETKTSTEKAFIQDFAKQIGNTGAMIRAVLAVAFGIVLLITGTTIAYSVKERTNELAVLKAVGFSDRLTMMLVLAESMVIAVVGGGLGLLLGAVVVQGLASALSNFLPVFYLPPRDLLVGAFFVLVLGALAGALPAFQALRLQVADALRRA